MRQRQRQGIVWFVLCGFFLFLAATASFGVSR